MSVNVVKLGAAKGEPLAYIMRGRQGDAAGAVSFRHEELGGDEVVEQLLHRCADLTVSGLVALFELEHHGLGGLTTLEALPHLDRRPLQAEVVAAREVDDDRLTAHGLRDHVRAVHPIPHRSSPLLRLVSKARPNTHC